MADNSRPSHVIAHPSQHTQQLRPACPGTRGGHCQPAQAPAAGPVRQSWDPWRTLPALFPTPAVGAAPVTTSPDCPGNSDGPSPPIMGPVVDVAQSIPEHVAGLDPQVPGSMAYVTHPARPRRDIPGPWDTPQAQACPSWSQDLSQSQDLRQAQPSHPSPGTHGGPSPACPGPGSSGACPAHPTHPAPRTRGRHRTPTPVPGSVASLSRPSRNSRGPARSHSWDPRRTSPAPGFVNCVGPCLAVNARWPRSGELRQAQPTHPGYPVADIAPPDPGPEADTARPSRGHVADIDCPPWTRGPTIMGPLADIPNPLWHTWLA
ncbi:uncharacterized protein LOC135215896 [Macrobrachium nipponense]|uniref:uncharacterized protein LOC135215896 n=1 Tax=Macrobrachium nipponense TaxID=159736 RepID=UPI0030C85F09